MNDISIKVLDVLFDLCEGEGYRILEAEEITSRVSYYTFLPDELTEILEVLVADGLIDLKYADNEEYCVSMRTKGRALIKQSRERLAKIVAEEPEILSYKKDLEEAEASRQERIALEEKKEKLKKESEETLRQAQESLDAAASEEEKAERQKALESAKVETKKRQDMISELENRIQRTEMRDRTRSNRSLLNATPEPLPAETDKKAVAVDPKKVFLFALLGSAVGALVVNLIFMIIILIKVC